MEKAKTKLKSISYEIVKKGERIEFTKYAENNNLISAFLKLNYPDSNKS